MTDKILEQAKHCKAVIAELDDAIRQFTEGRHNGVSIHLPDDEIVLQAVKVALIGLKDKFNKQFRDL